MEAIAVVSSLPTLFSGSGELLFAVEGSRSATKMGDVGVAEKTDVYDIAPSAPGNSWLLSRFRFVFCTGFTGRIFCSKLA